MNDCDPNSMLIWWPRVKDLGIPVPRTLIVPTPATCRDLLNVAMWTVEEGVDPPAQWAEFEAQVQAAGDVMHYPLFLRTDLFSGKHCWQSTCYVDMREDLTTHILRLVQEGELARIIGFQHRAVVVRELLRLHSTFTAFAGRMPISRERRYFVRDGEVLCHHPYWPAEAIRRPSREDWRERLSELNFESPEEIDCLTGYAGRVSQAMGEGHWSVDFASVNRRPGVGKTDTGDWYLIDMALGEESWHPEHE